MADQPNAPIRTLLSSPFLHAILVSGAAGLATHSAAATLAGFSLALGGSVALDRWRASRGPSRDQRIRSALAGRGADFLGLSEADGKGIGLAVARRTLILAESGPGGDVTASEHSLDLVGDVTWHVEVPSAANVYGVGPAAFAGAVQATSLNAIARRDALLRSGLRLPLGGDAPRDAHVCLDGDEGRMRRWASIIGEAREGRLPVPAEPAAA
jgi:hypothetical protein